MSVPDRAKDKRSMIERTLPLSSSTSLPLVAAYSWSVPCARFVPAIARRYKLSPSTRNQRQYPAFSVRLVQGLWPKAFDFALPGCCCWLAAAPFPGTATHYVSTGLIVARA
eukprot:550669-Rhodomonas_salina.1